MRYSVLVGVILTAWNTTLLYGQDPAPSAQLKQSAAWESYQSVEGGFGVLTPAPMRHRVDSSLTPIGKLVYHSFICREGADMVYLVSFCDYPEETVHSDSLDLLKEFFQATVEESIVSTEGELVYEEDYVFLGFPGKHWRINSAKTKSVIRSRAFVAKNRYYCVQTVMGRGQSLNPNSQRFLESFRLL